MNNLALAYASRIKGERADNIEQAINCLKQALSVRTRQALPLEWASTMNNLALAYASRIKGERAENLEKAINCYQQALSVHTRQASPLEWANTMNNLAAAYGSRIKGERADNIEQAINCLRQTISVQTRQALPLEWATTMNNLAAAYQERIKGERADNIEEAINCYQQALEVFQPDALPHDCRRTAYWLGRLLYDEERFAEARDAFIMAHEAVEFMRGEATGEEGRRRLAEENADLYARLVYCCLAVGDKASAFEYATMGKGRAFVDLLSSAQIDLTKVEDEEEEENKALQEKVAQAHALKARLDGLLGQLLGEHVGATLAVAQGEKNVGAVAQVAQLSDAQRVALTVDLQRQRKEEKELWEEIRQQFPDYFATQSAEPFTLAEAQGLASQLQATLVSYYRHDKGWVAFVIRPDLPFDSALKVVELPATTEELIEWWQFFNHKLSRCANTNLRRLTALYRALIKPLQPALTPQPLLPTVGKGEQPRLVLAPFSLLHLLPLAALRHKVGGEYRYLGEEYSVTITPTLAMLNRVKDRVKPDPARLCALAYPSVPGSKHYLPNVVPEVEAIASLFEPEKRRIFLKDQATTQAAIDNGPGSHIAHYSCHGLFDWSDVENSGLVLARGQLLNVRQIFNNLRLPDATLVTLSACDTGRVQVGGGDELAGLVQAFVYAGAPTVIASLWAVNDKATRHLFERFYRYYMGGISAADALRTAQQELRQQGYQHAYYWAAFQPQGAAYWSPTSATLPSYIPPASQTIPSYVARQPKGADEMSNPEPQEILDDAKKELRKLQLDAAELREEFEADDLKRIVNSLNTLSQQSKHINSQQGVLQLASDILSAIENDPALRQELMGNIDTQAQQQKRHLTIQKVEEGTKPRPSSHQEPQAIANTYGKMMRHVVELLQEKEDEEQKKEE